jgi:hypothetical protein
MPSKKIKCSSVKVDEWQGQKYLSIGFKPDDSSPWENYTAQLDLAGVLQKGAWVNAEYEVRPNGKMRILGAVATEGGGQKSYTGGYNKSSGGGSKYVKTPEERRSIEMQSIFVAILNNLDKLGLNNGTDRVEAAANAAVLAHKIMLVDNNNVTDLQAHAADVMDAKPEGDSDHDQDDIPF